MKRTLALVLAGFYILHYALSAQQIYISPSGDDDNSGTYDKPLASLTAARDRAREMRKSGPLEGAIEIIALPGKYFMTAPLELTPEDSGSPGSPTVFKGAEGGEAVFLGAIEITGWEIAGENLWRAFVPQVAYHGLYFEQLYVNGRRALRARSPDEGFFYVKGVEETIIEKGGGRAPQFAVQKIVVDSNDFKALKGFEGDDFNDALVVFYHNWDNTRKRILNISSAEPAFFIAGQGMKPWNPINSKSRWFVENYRVALDAPGEWYLDRSGYLYYIPLPGETTGNTVFHAPLLNEFIRIRGENPDKTVNNIRFENLTFSVAGYRTPPSGNEPAQAAAPVDAVVTLDFAKDISFINCEVSRTGSYAFWFRRGCSNCTVNRCYIHNLGAGGIKIGETTLRSSVNEITNNIVVDNNIITDAGHVFPCAVGVIIFHASDNKITHNEISNLRYSGISAGWIWGYAQSPSKRNLIAYNHIHHLGWGELCDMGGVYTLGASEGTVVANNVIHHVYSFDYGGWGLYTDEGSYGILMENNLVYMCKNSGFHQHYGKENIIRNNIFAFNIRAQLQATRVEEHRSLSFTNNIIYFDRGTLFFNNWHRFNVFTDYNCYWNTLTRDFKFGDKSFAEWQKSGKDQHSIIADPLFVNPEEFDFRFRNLSVTRKIKFVPFDYSKAGVYGDDAWRQKAVLDPALAKSFDERVAFMEEHLEK